MQGFGKDHSGGLGNHSIVYRSSLTTGPFGGQAGDRGPLRRTAEVRRVQRTIAYLGDGTGEAEATWFGRRFIERLKLFSHLANVGDAKSLVIHPASTTHAQLDAAALQQAGIGEGMIRLSVGLEDIDDLLDDLGQALRASQKA